MKEKHQPNRLMIVDDAMIMRRRIAEVATTSGWQLVAEAKDGCEAVAAYQEYRPNLVTLDIVMPNLDGVQTLRKIKEFDPESRVVMVSAVNQKDKLAACIQAGAMDFIVKPFDATRLQAFFERLLATESSS